MLTDFQNSFTDRLISNFAIKSLLNTLSHLNCVTTLPCEMSMFKKLPCSRTEWSKLPCKTQPVKTDVEKFLYSDINIVWVIDEKIYSVVIVKSHRRTVGSCHDTEEKMSRQMTLNSISGRLDTDGVCESASQNWSTLDWYLLILKLASMSFLT